MMKGVFMDINAMAAQNTMMASNAAQNLQEEERCPKCQKTGVKESRDICMNCKYIYPQEKFSIWVKIVASLFFFFLVGSLLFVSLSVCNWFIKDITLGESFASSFKFLSSKRLF